MSFNKGAQNLPEFRGTNPPIRPPMGVGGTSPQNLLVTCLPMTPQKGMGGQYFLLFRITKFTKSPSMDY